ncbi:hypothetical protein DIPPA_31358, partial [Diplonema papillatum]
MVAPVAGRWLPLPLLLFFFATGLLRAADGQDVSVWRGVFEEKVYSDIRFWTTITKYTADAWDDACSAAVLEGRRGRVARVYTKEENDRIVAEGVRLGLHLGLGGDDRLNSAQGKPRVFRWTDGSSIWEQSASPGCSQKFCDWGAGEPSSTNDHELLFYKTSRQWIDISTISPWSPICEFPCTSNADCSDRVDHPTDPFVCHRTTGRCVLTSECSKYSFQSYEEGFYEEAPGEDVAFWLSSISVQRPSAENACKLMCRNGRTGRLARVLSPEEEQRVAALFEAANHTTLAHADGSDEEEEGVWKYSDGRAFYSGSTCVQGHCGWTPGEPSQAADKDYLLLNGSGHWYDATRYTSATRYLCEFPCYSDEDCGEGYMCHMHGRCVKKSECTAYGRLDVHGNGTLDAGTRKDIRLWYSGAALKATRSAALTMCRELCLDGKYGRLFELRTAEEELEMKKLMNMSTGDPVDIGADGVYMGGYKDAKRQRWASGQSFTRLDQLIQCRQSYCNWKAGHPTLDASTKYIRVDSEGKWVSTEGTTARPWLCEFPCRSDEDCESGYTCLENGRCVEKKGATCAYGFQLYSDGVAETNASKDIFFWTSTAKYEWNDRYYVCRDMCFDGRVGREARVHSLDEMNRLKAILILAGNSDGALGGSDMGHEGTWAWRDGPVFYTTAGGNQQKFVSWNPTQPDNSGGIQHVLMLLIRGDLDDVAPIARATMCEFPCYSDDDCADADYVCHYTGRCVLHSHCNPEGEYSVDSGTVEEDTGASIRFWSSGELKLPYDDSSAVCRSLCLEGRYGRLARILSAGENYRASALAAGAQSFIDGTYDSSSQLYQWSDGSIIYKVGYGCEQGFCLWASTIPTQQPYMTVENEAWSDTNRASQRFTCEFPCIADADCNVGDDPCPIYECTRHGRCVLNPVCFRDGKCSSFRAELECTFKDTCEWDQTAGATGACVDAPCKYDNTTCLTYAACEWNDACSDVSDHECVRKRCAATQQETECTADPRCAWSGSACALASCAQFPSEKCCDAEIGCSWSTHASPAFCEMTYCAATYPDKVGCGTDLKCMWHGGACTEVQCPLLDECNCKAHDLCLWDGGACASSFFTECPALDIVVMLAGSYSMTDSFGRHPHGFYALAEVLRDWVEKLPLSGEKAGEVPTTSSPTGFRVGFVQFAGSSAQSALAATTGESGFGTKGRLSGVIEELESDITWHEYNLIGGTVRISAGLSMASAMFGAADHGRTRILLVFADEDIQDRGTIETQLTALGSQGVEIFGVAVRRFETKQTSDMAAENALSVVKTSVAAHSALNLQIKHIEDSFLFDMCNSASPFVSIVSKTTEPVQVGIHRACPLYTESHNCTQDPGCTWHSVDQECINSACVRVCTKAECQAETSHMCRWTDNGWCMKETVCAFSSEDLCVNSMQLCDWNGGACKKTPCVSVGTEQECIANDEDCTWWTINGGAECIATPCTATNGAVCEQDTKCRWATDPCDSAAGPVCELASCSVYLVTTECNGDPRCSMNGTQCQMKPCAEYASELCCDRVTECGWDVSTSPATCQLKTCYRITQPASCGANLECMWSASENRCVDLAARSSRMSAPAGRGRVAFGRRACRGCARS